MNHGDYYQILGVDKTATSQTIKEAYRRLAFQFHPDRNKGNPSAVERMKEINEAYAVLSDPKKKRDYDTLRDQYGSSGYDRFKRSYSEEDIFRGSDIDQIFEEMARAFGLRNFGEVFRETYGQGYRTFEFRRPGVFARGFIFFGPGRRRANPSEIPTSFKTFPRHLGRFSQVLLGKMLGIRLPQRGKDLEDVIHLTPLQAREGARGRYHHRRRSKELMITIPPGVREGQKIRLKGMGAEGKEGGDPGDLYLKVRIKKSLLQRIRELLRI
ncbi:MAG: DnaJ domain-containing protein [Thermodesulfobacteriota bacterium]